MTDGEGGPGRSDGPAPARRVELALVAVLGLAAPAALWPIGWDRFGPIRWLLVPTAGFALIAVVVGRVGLRWPAGSDRLGRAAVGAWAALLAWGLVASTLGVDPLHAWIGTPDRRFGWLLWLLCGALFLVGRWLGPAAIAALVKAMAVGALALGLHAVAQWAGLVDDGGLGGGGFDGGRIGGLLGQPAYLGAAAALVVPVAAGLALDRVATPRWRLVGAAGAVLGVAALLLSQSRAAWLGSAVALAVVTLVWLRRSAPGDTTARWGPVAALAGGAVLLVATVPVLRGRIVDAAGDGGVVEGRLAEWRVGLRALGDSPLVGYGPEGYRTVFGAQVDADYVRDWGREVITDRAHNGLLDTGLAFGLPGLVLAAAVLVVVGVAAIRVLALGADDDRPVGSPALGGAATAVIAYGVGQQFLFPLAELDPLFWLLAGIVTAAAARPSLDRARGPALAGSVVGGLAAGLAVVAGLAGLADLVADLDVDRATDGDPGAIAEGPDGGEGAGPEIDRALSLRPDSIRYHFIASRLASQHGDLALALVRVDQGLDRSPTDPALRGERAALLLELARSTDEPAGRAEALALAVDELTDLVADDPLHPRHLQRLGVALALSGQLEEARANLERAVSLAPGDPDAATNLQLVESLIEEERQRADGNG